MVYIKLFGKEADAVARKLEEKGLINPFESGNAQVDTRIKFVCRSVEGRPVTAISFEL